MKPRSLPLREAFLLGAPLLIIVFAGAFLSKGQSERLAEQRRLESGPLRLVITNVHSMPVVAQDKQAGYNFSIRIDGRIEGEFAPDWQAAPRKGWVLRSKSAQIFAGQNKKPSRIINTFSPYDPTKVPRTNILGIAESPSKARELALWVLCDAPLSNSVLSLELEAVGSDAKSYKALGPYVVAPLEKLQLRAFDFNDASANKWKNL